MTHVTCRLTAKNRHQLRNPTLGNRVWATFFSTRRALLGLTIVTVCQPTLYKVSSDSVAIFKHMAFLCSVYFCFLELILFFFISGHLLVLFCDFFCVMFVLLGHISLIECKDAACCYRCPVLRVCVSVSVWDLRYDAHSHEPCQTG